MAKVKEAQGQLVFGLDIGTRSIVGTVGYMNGGKFHVVAQYAKEHETRAMLDGQIHDIGKVGDTIHYVKSQLEKELDRELTDVCIAAAGRVLRTVTTSVEHTFDSDKEITEEDINALSTLGVEKAYEEFLKANNDLEMKFYCVGYTPMRYYMNGYPISNLEGHKARTIGIDLIATFLPDDVVDGLYKAVELAGLRVANLTLEPIAAIQVAIPEKFRMLNMALVDVGAGTSDISITKDGMITAYGMIPVAGDSLTDIIVQHCLVDFETAEKIKRQSGEKEVVEYLDIMGLPQTITAQEVADILSSSVEKMTHLVADCIRELNGDKSVSAVFVVGGGGMIPGYTEMLAADLGIVKERVAIRGQEVMQSIVFEMEDPRKDAMMVTPIGICLSYYEQSNNFIFIEFNGERMKLYDNGKLTVADAAVQAQYPNENLFPKRGKALTFTVNGKSRMVRGLQGEAAVILVNGQQADMYTQVHSGDKIEVVASTMGESAKQELGKLTELSDRLHVYVNGKKIDLPKSAEVNGKRETEFYQINEGDEIQVHNSYTVKEVAEFLDMPLGGDIRVNDTAAKADTRVYENFTVSWSDKVEALIEDTEAPEETAQGETVVEETPEGYYDEEDESEEVAEEENVAEVIVEASKSVEVPKNVEVSNAVEQTKAVEKQVAPIQPEKSATQDTPTQPEAPAKEKTEEKTEEQPAPPEPIQMVVFANKQTIVMSGKAEYVYVDIFDYINFEISPAASKGRSIVTLLNGRPAQYMEPLTEGDHIEVYWK
uniref:cell division protein FtsA n=1 Tax=Acetatifactor sp. TaxID=1872090 RepID=UPI004056F19C